MFEWKPIKLGNKKIIKKLREKTQKSYEIVAI